MDSNVNSPYVIFFEFVNGDKDKPAVIHFTARAKETQSANEFFQEVKDFIRSVDPTANLEFKFQDAPKGFGGRGGGSKPSAKLEIKDNKFLIKQVTRIEKPNGKDASKPWSHFVAFGTQDGQEIEVSCFVGNSGWQKSQNPVTDNLDIPSPFPNFFSWAVNERKDASSLNLEAIVKKNEQFKNYEIVSIVPASS